MVSSRNADDETNFVFRKPTLKTFYPGHNIGNFLHQPIHRTDPAAWTMRLGDIAGMAQVVVDRADHCPDLSLSSGILLRLTSSS